MTTQITLMTSRQVEEKCVKDPLWSSSQLLRMDAHIQRLQGDMVEARSKLLLVCLELQTLIEEIDDDDHAAPDVSNAGG